MRISSRKTPVAILRSILGLSVKEFAEIIGKSPSTIPALETGRLPLSEDTALRISRETGVALAWLLDGDPDVRPYHDEVWNGGVYDRETFEEIQAYKKENFDFEIIPPEDTPDRLLISSIATTLPWLSIYSAARKQGKDKIAIYVLHKCFREMQERFGRDEEIEKQVSDRTRITQEDQEWTFHYDSEGKAFGLDCFTLTQVKGDCGFIIRKR
jgi:transcriptional regulator with XRE-family HTH domain